MRRVIQAAAAIAAVAVLAVAALAQQSQPPPPPQGQPQPPPQGQPQPQPPLHFSSAEGSEVRVDGDSSLHKWTVKGRQIDGTIDFRVDVPPNASARQIVDAVVANPRVAARASVPATTLKSTKTGRRSTTATRCGNCTAA